MKIYILSALLAFALSFAFLLVLIPLLKRLKAGQNILSYVKEHKSKGGTPTMGGIAFIFAAVIAFFVFFNRVGREELICVAVGLSCLLVGFLDDWLKCSKSRNLGLKAWQKLVFQAMIAIFLGVYCFRAGKSSLWIPFTKIRVNVGAWILPLSLLFFLGTVNAVNLTDGLDGLAAGVSMPFFLLFGIIVYLQTHTDGIPILCFCLSGALTAYLLFNASPASVFMGDTGSLALGGFVSAIALISENVMYILVLGACFVFSVISVVIQVIYYKATGGKRVFLMAPAHHHFQQKGYSETRISYAYFTITLLFGLLCVAFIV